MNHLPRKVLIFAVMPLLASCAMFSVTSTGSSTPKYEALLPNALRVCDISANPKAYFGKTVVIEGLYQSDGANYSYIQDARCPKYTGIIGIGYVVPDRDLSVNLFNKAGALRCHQVLCITDAHIIVRGVIVKQREPGHLGLGKGAPLINLQSVLYVNFLRNGH